MNSSSSTPRENEAGAQAGPSDGVAELRPAAPVMPGEVVAGKYQIERMIGFGGMGVVCEGTHLELGTKVAVKFVRPEYAHDETVVTRFLSEARAAAQLRSQHTCLVMDCGRLATGSPYMVMEYLDGADLRRIVAAQGHMPVEEAVSFALQACEALAEAHSRGIVHRDVKPENLFLMHGPGGGPLIKVLDFGISKQLGLVQGGRDLTQRSDSIGSPHHMSPEQMIDPSAVDTRTDIWSLGVLLYELLTGQLPFRGESLPQVCANVLTLPPPSPRDINPEIPELLAQVVLRCMDKNRDARFPDVAALGHALREYGGAAASVTAARVERILERARSKSAPAPAVVSSKSGFVRVSPPGGAAETEAPLSIPGVPRSRTGALYGVFAGVALVLVVALIWWLKARGASDSSAAASTSTPSPSAATLSDPRHDAVTLPTSMPSPTLPKLFHKPAPEPAPAPTPAPPVVSAKAPLPAPVSSATPKQAVKKPFTPRPPPDNAASVEPLPAQTSVYPELKAPELPPNE